MTYIDRDGQPLTLTEWASQLGGSRVARTTVGDAEVSTVWTGVSDSGHIFETMIFGGPYNERSIRYRTELDALKGHLGVVADLVAGRAPEVFA